jgi:hypothetical protein
LSSSSDILSSICSSLLESFCLSIFIYLKELCISSISTLFFFRISVFFEFFFIILHSATYLCPLWCLFLLSWSSLRCLCTSSLISF